MIQSIHNRLNTQKKVGQYENIKLHTSFPTCSFFNQIMYSLRRGGCVFKQ